MHLPQLNSKLNPAVTADGDIVGLSSDGMVLHFDADNGTVYQTGLNLQDWLDGHSEAWAMTEEEATRVGIVDYDAYYARLRERNPSLFGLMP